MSRVDFGFIGNLEGGQWLKGYVPNPAGSQSGVTIATGFDLGARNSNDLQSLGLPATLVNKLSRYCNKTRFIAKEYLTKNPLTITKEEADRIDTASKKSALDMLVARYDKAIPRTSQLLRFEQLPSEAQTVIASVAFQYGDLATRTPRFWKTVTEQRWQAAINELRNFNDAYGPRRGSEADLLSKVLNSRVTPVSDTRPAVTNGSSGNATGQHNPPSTPVQSKPFDLGLGKQHPKALSGSVGQGGKNFPDDVRLVQTLLNEHLPIPASPVQVTGRVDQHLITVITHYQRQIVGMARPDGRIDPGGRTFQSLTGVAPHTQHPSTSPTPKQPSPKQPSPNQPSTSPVQSAGKTGDLLAATRDFCFPFPSLPIGGYKSDGRQFGANRSKGRKHGGCDLLFPVGTWIYAVADGTIIQRPYNFYLGTQALEVHHGNLIVRYGEIKPGSFVGGTTVKKGQRLCQVGKLQGMKASMLHIEMYKGTASGSLTDVNNPPYKRRKDLLDPTPFLDLWAKNFPST